MQTVLGIPILHWPASTLTSYGDILASIRKQEKIVRIQILYPDTRLNKARPLQAILFSLDESCDAINTGGFWPANLSPRLF
ncbi:hypothetical protein EcCFBP13530_23615 [Enterobacter cancerogenus]|uniref:Uncharacterized protein n=1 Tax=Enterobacter cancerogenus TaxID=69218 RepID=A0AB38NXK7_9ENTR|nr:hypothetical protein EcCFBP13530_23615 [Enterobacter cancerogenus]